MKIGAGISCVSYRLHTVKRGSANADELTLDQILGMVRNGYNEETCRFLRAGLSDFKRVLRARLCHGASVETRMKGPRNC